MSDDHTGSVPAMQPFGPPDFIPPPPPPPPAPTSGVKRFALFALLFLAGTATGSGVAAGVMAARHTSSPVASVSGTSSNGAAPVNGNNPTSPAPSGGGASSSDVAAAVDPAVVDINGVLAGGGGQVAGTGMVLTSEGIILTNNHVIEDTSSLTVQIDGAGQTYSATVMGTDATDDVALIKINASGLKTVNLGDSSSVSVGQTIIAIGNALGQGGTPAVTQGSITALDQTITAGDTAANTETLHGMIQIDAFIQPGDSGGPLVDTSGHVLGIDTAAQSSGRFNNNSGSNVAFAVPINAALSIARQIEAGQSSSTVQIGTRGILGVGVGSGASTSGAAVSTVESGSPAANAGIVAGDVITKVDGNSVTDSASLRTALRGKRPGETVSVTWTDSSGGSHTASITLEAGPPA